MPYIEIKSFLGRSKGAGTIHALILVGSDPYTHSELVFPDGLSFSSEISLGARFKQINYSHPERWHTDRIQLHTDIIARIRIRAELMVAMGLEYDMGGAVNSPFFGMQNPGKVFCSESIGYCLAPDLIGVDEVHHFHPNKLQIIAKALSIQHS